MGVREELLVVDDGPVERAIHLHAALREPDANEEGDEAEHGKECEGPDVGSEGESFGGHEGGRGAEEVPPART